MLFPAGECSSERNDRGVAIIIERLIVLYFPGVQFPFFSSALLLSHQQNKYIYFLQNQTT